MSKPFVAIVMGSDSDLPVMEASFDVLRSFGIEFEARITSAHRTPEATKEFVKDAEERGCAVFIAAAGISNTRSSYCHLCRPVQQLPALHAHYIEIIASSIFIQRRNGIFVHDLPVSIHHQAADAL